MTTLPVTTIRDALAEVGMADRPDGDVVLMAMVNGKPRHATLAAAADTPVTDPEALYVASGLFAPGVVSIKGGRTTEHCTRVVWMPFDADLIAMLDPDKVTADDLHAAPQDEIDAVLADQITEVDRAFAACGWPIHRLDYTGYGLCAYVYVDDADQHRVADAQDTHKRAVAALNEAAGFPLFDRQVSDAGPRVTRVPGSLNRKGPTPRVVRTLRPWDGRSIPLTHRPAPAATATPVDVPVDGSGLSAEAADAIVDAIAPAWSEGQRHAMGVAVAGLLAKSGVPETQALDIVGRLAAGDKKPYDRFNALRRSYDRVRSGQAVAGYTQLQQLIPQDALAFVANVLDRFQESTAAVPDLTAFDAAAQASVGRSIDASEALRRRERDLLSLVPEPPEECFYGWVGQYRDIVAPTTEAADALHLGAILTACGAHIGRKVATELGSDPIYPTLYTVLVGATGWSRKETAMRRALDDLGRTPVGSFQAASPAYQEVSDLTSAEGLAEVMERTPNTLIRLSELTLLFSNMQRKGTTNLADQLIRLWDAPAQFQILRAKSATKVERPSLSILAATQPGRLADAMTHEHIISGFANRLVFVAGDAKPEMAEPSQIDRGALWELFRDFQDAVQRYPDGTVLARAPETDARWNAWYGEIRRQSADEELSAMRARHQALALKVALIYAVTDSADRIEAHHLEPAIAFVEWMWRNLLLLMKRWGVGHWSQIEQRIEETLRVNGPMKRHPLSRKCANRKWNNRDFSIVLDSLIKTESVLVNATGICSWAEG